MLEYIVSKDAISPCKHGRKLFIYLQLVRGRQDYLQYDDRAQITAKLSNCVRLRSTISRLEDCLS